MVKNSIDIIQNGKFVVGVNYWASHAGTNMWSDWREEVVDQDLTQLEDSEIQVLRVFPLWSDFQPIKRLYGGAGSAVEFRFGENNLPDDEIGKAGLNPVMIERFQTFCDLAVSHGLRLIVGLITGWMSGRLYVPQGLDGLNVLIDPEAIQWEVRFIRTFVRHFKGHPAILAWDLGNECNCMANIPNRQAAWMWTNTITSAIRLEDLSRPVVSGMHSLLPGQQAHWTMQDQGELTDLLTSHPYPYFTPHCDQDPVNTIRTILHSTAESRFYADIGGKPCMAEEIGTLGPILASEKIAADFIRTCLFSLWAHDCHGLLWWCAFDQLHLEHAPYDWAACERELGLIRKDRSLKPVVNELTHFRNWLHSLPIGQLPKRKIDAVCILTEGQDQWGAAYSSFILAKQAGFDLEFQFADQPLKPAKVYLLPSVCGMSSISRKRWLELLQAVNDGAILYLSHQDGLLSPFNKPFGLEIQTRERSSGPTIFICDGVDSPFSIQSLIHLNIQAGSAQVLAWEENGNPVFTCSDYGKGKAYFLSVPIELFLANFPGGFHTVDAQPYWQIYRTFLPIKQLDRIITKDQSQIGITEHPVTDDQRIVVVINYSPDRLTTDLHLKKTWNLTDSWYGDIQQNRGILQCTLPPNEAIVACFNKLN
jgi:endo-1,4-beta-mannosidase